MSDPREEQWPGDSREFGGDSVPAAGRSLNQNGERWRDEDRLPLDELTNAMAVYSTDGQADDTTAGDAGAEAQYGESAAESVDRADQLDSDTDLQYAPDAPGSRARHGHTRPGPESRRGPDSG